MKKKLLFLMMLIIPVLFTNCFIYESAETRIKIDRDETGEYAKVTSIYNNISSCEAKEEDAKKDFESLLEMVQGDEYLMDEADKGMYWKERDMWVEKDQVQAKQVGITRDFDLLQKEYGLIHMGDEYLIVLKKEDNILLETNGKQVETDTNLIIYWNQEQKDLYFKVKPTDDCGSFDVNQKKMVKWVKEYKSQN